ncbi:MAG: NAD(P)/FAD-dependent oxidoreductase [Phycisphaerales bacterium]
MDLLGGAPFWLLRAGIRSVAPPLTKDATADVLVIGSGITGSLVALALAERGLRVIVVDRRDLCTGSTMASTALLTYELDAPLYRLESSVGSAIARAAYGAGLAALECLRRRAQQLEVPLIAAPSVLFATTPRADHQLEREFVARSAVGIRVVRSTSAHLRRRFGLAARGGLVSRQAALVDPFELSHALLRAALLLGTRLFDRTRVTDIDVSCSGCIARTEAGPCISSAYVVDASGYEAAPRLPPGLVTLASSYALVTEPLPRAPRPFLCWQRAKTYFYARSAGTRLMVGGGDEPFVDAPTRDSLLPAKARSLLHRVRLYFPDLRPATAFSWTGTFASTPDGIGYVGSLRSPRYLFALGFGGNGITCAATASMLLCDVIAGTALLPPEVHAAFSFHRRSSAPHAPTSPITAPTASG